MDQPVTLFHGMSLWSWRVVNCQGRLRPAYTARDGERLYKVVEGRGFVYFCSDPGMAAIYAGGNPALRLPTLAGRGRWKLPGGIANQDGVVIAGDFEPGEMVYTRRPNSHEEWVSDRPVTVSRLRVVAFIPEGSKVAEAVERREELPPLSDADRERLEAIDPDEPIAWPGPRIADLEAAQRPLRFLKRRTAAGVDNPEQVSAQGGDWRAALERLAARRQGRDDPGRFPAIGEPPRLLPK